MGYGSGVSWNQHTAAVVRREGRPWACIHFFDALGGIFRFCPPNRVHSDMRDHVRNVQERGTGFRRCTTSRPVRSGLLDRRAPEERSGQRRRAGAVDAPPPPGGEGGAGGGDLNEAQYEGRNAGSRPNWRKARGELRHPTSHGGHHRRSDELNQNPLLPGGWAAVVETRCWRARCTTGDAGADQGRGGSSGISGTRRRVAPASSARRGVSGSIPAPA
jgi:hypothetical protein